MRLQGALALVAGLLVAVLSHQASAGTGPSSPEMPWARAQAVLDATAADVKTSGYNGIAAHLSDLEAALASGKDVKAAASAGIGDTRYVLTDGPGDALMAMLFAAAPESGRKAKRTVAVNNPFPAISLYIGSYYNEVGRREDAVRALDAGLALDSVAPDIVSGDHAPYLYAERAAALYQLHRMADALASFDKGLDHAELAPRQRALLLRGRGSTLIELGRLDEAESAYRESLKIEPKNELAQHELKYIAGLRAGAAPAPTPGLAPASPPPKTP